MRNRKVIAFLATTIVIACVIAGYVIYLQTFPPEFEPYTSVFHISFEDKTGVFLGNLTGEFKINKGNASNVDSTLTLTFLSERLDVKHEPYINNVTLAISFAVMFFESGRVPIVPVPPSQRQTLKDGEKVVFHESYDVSKLKRPMIFIYCVIPSYQTINDTIPSIQVYFSDGQVWRCNQNLYPLWQDKYEYPPGAISVELRELSGKTETTTITLITVEKVNSPPLLRALTFIFNDVN